MLPTHLMEDVVRYMAGDENTAHLHCGLIMKHKAYPEFKKEWKSPYLKKNPYLVNACRDGIYDYINYLMTSQWNIYIYEECLKYSAEHGNLDMIKYIINNGMRKLPERLLSAHDRNDPMIQLELLICTLLGMELIMDGFIL